MRLVLLRILPFAVVIGLCACSARHKQLLASTNDATEEANVQPLDTIAFLLFTIHYDKSKTNSVLSLKSITKNPGRLKDKNPNADLSGDKLCFFFYDKKDKTDSLFIEHPLRKNIEFIDGNNQYVNRQLDLDSTGFFIRIQLKENYKTLIVSEVLQKNYHSLLTVPLK